MFNESKTVDGHYELVTSECYDKVNKLEAIKVKKDTEAMRIIIKHYQTLWT